jgi:hypothetical protein
MDSGTIATNSANVRADGSSRVQIWNSYSTTVHNHADSDRDSCLADPHLAGPREENAHIEQTKGSLFRDAYKCILDNDKFQRWRYDKRRQVL